MTSSPMPRNGQPIIFRNGSILTMDAQHSELHGADLLVVDGRIAAVGYTLDAPDNAFEIDASGGIVMPGMIDTHRHMWQSVMRGYGADWSLSQYFVWYYLNHGSKFRPQDISAGNRLSALDAAESGVTTTVDWSHGLFTPEHGEAAYEALASSPGRFILAYSNLSKQPSEWANDPQVRRIIEQAHTGGELFGAQMAIDVTGEKSFPEREAFHIAEEIGVPVTTHAGIFNVCGDDSINVMYENGVMRPDTIYVHAATLGDDSYRKIADTGGAISLATESEETCGQGYPPSDKLIKYGIKASLSVDTSVMFSADLFSAMRATVGAHRAKEHLEAHAKNESVTHSSLRVEDVVHWATRGGAIALGKDHLVGSLEPGKLADVVMIKNDSSPTMFPVINPYAHLVYQVGRGDVDTVLVNGAPVKFQGRLVSGDLNSVRRDVEDTVDYLSEMLGKEQWNGGMFQQMPGTD